MPRSQSPRPRSRLLPAFLALAAAPAAALAQTDTLPWTSGVDGSAGPFTGTTMARLSGDLLADVAMATDGQLLVAEAVAAFCKFREVTTSGTANDVATLRIEGLAVEDDRDHLVVAASDGLWTLREGSGGTFTATAVDASSGWQGIKRVVVADLNGDDRDDLVVLKTNGRSIDCKLQTSTGGWSDTSDYQWTANFDVLDFALADLDGNDSTIELAVNDTRALRIFSPGNSLLAGHTSLRSTFDRMAIVHGDARGGGDNWVAWVTASSATSTDPWRNLYLVTTSAAIYCDSTDEALGPVVGGRFHAGDGGDLAFMVDGESTLRVLVQLDDTPAFDFSSDEGATFDLGGSTSTAAARPAAGDLAHDFDMEIEELFVPLASEGALTISYNSFGDTMPAVFGNPDFEEVGQDATPEASPDVSAAITILAEYPGVSGVVEDTEWYVDCTVWHQIHDLGDPFATSFVHSCRRPLAEALVTGDILALDFEVPDFDDLYYILVRVVHLTTSGPPQGPINAALPNLMGAFSANDGANLNALEEDYWHSTWTETVPLKDYSQSTPPRVGGFIRIRRFPPSTPLPANPPNGTCN